AAGHGGRGATNRDAAKPGVTSSDGAAATQTPSTERPGYSGGGGLLVSGSSGAVCASLFSGQPCLSTLVPAVVPGHSSLPSHTPSRSLSEHDRPVPCSSSAATGQPTAFTRDPCGEPAQWSWLSGTPSSSSSGSPWMSRKPADTLTPNAIILNELSSGPPR